MNKLIFLAVLPIVLSIEFSAKSQPVKSTSTQSSQTKKSFINWCLEKDILSSDYKATIEGVLYALETQDCIEANKTLIKRKDLKIFAFNLEPIRSLSHINSLTITMSSFYKSDLSPLRSLPNLRYLWISGGIGDITPIASLKELNQLNLVGKILTIYPH
jgi:internalin A